MLADHTYIRSMTLETRRIYHERYIRRDRKRKPDVGPPTNSMGVNTRDERVAENP